MNLPANTNTNLMATETRLGFEEHTDIKDLIMPRAKLLQSKSPEVEEPVYEGKYRAGQIINSVTLDQVSGVFVPVFKFTNWIRFNPRDRQKAGFDATYNPGDIIWMSNDPNDQRVLSEGEWGPNGERPLATKFLNFFAVFEGDQAPTIISFSNTSYKTGRKLLSLCQFSGGNMFSRKYALKSKMEEKDGNKYFVFEVMPLGALDKESELYKLAYNYHSQFGMQRRDEIIVHDQVETVAEDWERID